MIALMLERNSGKAISNFRFSKNMRKDCTSVTVRRHVTAVCTMPCSMDHIICAFMMHPEYMSRSRIPSMNLIISSGRLSVAIV